MHQHRLAASKYVLWNAFLFLMLLSNSLLMELSSIPNVRCILALMLPSSVGMIAHIHTAARYVKGLEMGALQGLH